jgi:hypothetical protein
MIQGTVTITIDEKEYKIPFVAPSLETLGERAANAFSEARNMYLYEKGYGRYKKEKETV